MKRQDDFSREIDNLRIEITHLQSAAQAEEAEPVQSPEVELADTDADSAHTRAPVSAYQPAPPEKPSYSSATVNAPPTNKSDIEKFIGENLANKIGIIITVIGVAIGAKYSIENGLISPLTRIILGYLTALVLLGIGIKLKTRYTNYSAVLVSGAMAIMYFITYTAYSFYHLIPQALAFFLMVIFTAFTAIAAIHYNRQVIAHIGLVGAYAIPFLLSSNSGNATVLFTYMAIINTGILVISVYKYWKSLYYSSFGLSWLIYSWWYMVDYQPEKHFALALTFISVFFVIFYLTFLAYKSLRKEKFEIADIVLLLSNSFISYGIGYSILNNHITGSHLLGLYTLCNAIAHFIVSVMVYRLKLADKNIFYLVVGLVLVFITIAIPVQLNGDWVTLLWVAEAALLFWIGRVKNVTFYERLSFPLMILAFISIIQDWSSAYSGYSAAEPHTVITPFLNIHFLGSVLFIAAFAFIYFLNRKNKFAGEQNLLTDLFSYVIPAILLITLYFAFRLEISTYWKQLYTDSVIKVKAPDMLYPFQYKNDDLKEFGIMWVINYSLLFIAVLSLINTKKIKNHLFGIITFALITLSVILFLTQGLYILSELRERYVEGYLAEYFHRGEFSLVIRYISFIFVGGALAAGYFYVKQNLSLGKFNVLFDLLLHVTIVWIASSELINWMDISGSTQSYKLGLSILWGTYSLLLVVIGISRKTKHLRIGAITLFGATLLKLFFYDLSHLNTIAKTIVFVSLGVLLLIISYLYNRYKHTIADDVEI
jgi:uncharacterized membrane protein